MKTEMPPVGYSIMFMLNGYSIGDRKQGVAVIAADATEAIAVAESYARGIGKLNSVEPWKPRWVQSDTDVPDVVSESVLRQYAAKLGLEIVRPIAAGQE